VHESHKAHFIIPDEIHDGTVMKLFEHFLNHNIIKNKSYSDLRILAVRITYNADDVVSDAHVFAGVIQAYINQWTVMV